jgi:uncharacterized protein
MPALDRPFSVDLRGIEEGSHRLRLTEEGRRLELPEDEIEVSGEVKLDLALGISGVLVTARGSVTAPARLQCSRCLEPFESELEADFEVVFRRGGDGLLPEDEDDVPVFLGDEWVAFDEAARESLLLVVPMKPLCRDACRGLCPVCGTNLNGSECGCPREQTDSRWDGLRNLLD